MCGIENIRMATKTKVTNTQRVRMVAHKNIAEDAIHMRLRIGYIGHKTKLMFFDLNPMTVDDDDNDTRSKASRSRIVELRP